MSGNEQSNLNHTNDAVTTTVTINSVTATELLPANPNRLYAFVSLDSGLTDIQAFVREYAAATDNIKKGEILARVTVGNNNLYKPMYRTLETTVYRGAISAIAAAGSFNVHVIEGSK